MEKIKPENKEEKIIEKEKNVVKETKSNARTNSKTSRSY